jgi:20S proteasome alpha/beta subunit
MSSLTVAHSFPLQEPSSVDKIMEIDSHIACAMSGLTADAPTLVEHGRVETQVCHRMNKIPFIL